MKMIAIEPVSNYNITIQFSNCGVSLPSTDRVV